MTDPNKSFKLFKSEKNFFFTQMCTHNIQEIME